MWTTKKKLKNENAQLKEQLDERANLYNELLEESVRLFDMLNEYRDKYPFDMGQIVYDVQLRSSKGRFTKTKASREHSIINEVVVDKKNYFNLVDRYNAHDVFVYLEQAESHLDSVCVE